MTFFMHEQHYRDLRPVREQTVTICGAGALGANLAETLARMGMSRLRIIDRDRIEAHNLSTQPWTQQDVGTPKARTLAILLYRAVGAQAEPHQIELTSSNAERLLAGSAVVADCFDNLEGRAAVVAATRALSIPCLHLALSGSGDYGCGLWGQAYVPTTDPVRTTQELQGCDYPLTRPLALLVAAAGAEALVGAVLGEGQRGFELTLRDLRMNPV